MRHLIIMLIAIYSVFGNTRVFAQSSYRTRMQDFYMAKSIRGNKMVQRISLGIGKTFIPGTISLHYAGIPDSSYVDTVIEMRAKSRGSVTAHLGVYFPISIVSDNSMLVLNIEGMFNMTTMTHDTIYFSDSAKLIKPFRTIRGGLPISLEYRMGGDVSLNREDAALFTIGGGICPTMVNTYDEAVIPRYKFIPFVKVEAGFVAVAAIKLRAMYYFRSSLYRKGEEIISVRHNTDYLSSEYRGSNGFSLSIIIMPFSWKWN